MITDSKCFLTGEPHISRNNINALFSVTVRKSVVILKGINSLPCALFVLYVTEAFFVYSDFTKVVKKSNNSNTLVGIGKSVSLLDTRGVEIFHEALIYVERVVA